MCSFKIRKKNVGWKAGYLELKTSSFIHKTSHFGYVRYSNLSTLFKHENSLQYLSFELSMWGFNASVFILYYLYIPLFHIFSFILVDLSDIPDSVFGPQGLILFLVHPSGTF